MAEDPARFWDENQSELMRSLLSAAREEQPEHAALERTLAVIGAGSALATLATSSTATGIGSAQGLAATATVSSAKGALGSSLLVVVKWLGAGMVMGLAATSAVYVATAPKAPASPPASPKVTLARPTTAQKPGRIAPAAAVASATEVGDAPLVAKAPTPSSAALSVSAAPTASAVPTAVEPDAQLAAELSLLDRARQALAAGNAASALRSLNDYEARFAHPNLLPEALYLRLEALTLLGDQPGTQVVAKRMLRSFPSGPYSARARAVLGI